MSKTFDSLIREYYDAVFHYGKLNGREEYNAHITMNTYEKAEHRIDEKEKKLKEFINENMVHE